MDDIFDDEFLNEDVKEEGVESVGAVIEPSEPFWRMDKKPILHLCKVVKEVALKSSDLISKSVFLEYKDGHVVASATNKVVYLSYDFTLKNQQNVLQAAFAIPVKQLESIAQYSADVIFYKAEDQFYASLMGGREVLDQVFVDNKVFVQQDKGVRKASVRSDGLKSELSLMLRLLMFAIVPEDRKMVIEDGAGYGNFLSVLVKVRSCLPEMVIRNADLKSLYFLCESGEEQDIVVEESQDRFSFISSVFRYSTVKSPYVKSGLKEHFVFQPENEIVIDGNLAANIFSFLSLRASDSGIGRIFNDEGKLKVAFQDKKSKYSEFLLGSYSEGKLSVDLQVALAKRIFVIMKEDMVHLQVVNSQLAYWNNDITVLQGVRSK